MNPRQTVYQDPESPDSLAAALRLWLDLVSAKTSARNHQLVFVFRCPGESRARRVAAYLKRRLQCASTTIQRIDDGNHREWQVEGLTRAETPSLPDLERLFGWLGGAATRHQVELRGINIR